MQSIRRENIHHRALLGKERKKARSRVVFETLVTIAVKDFGMIRFLSSFEMTRGRFLPQSNIAKHNTVLCVLRELSGKIIYPLMRSLCETLASIAVKKISSFWRIRINQTLYDLRSFAKYLLPLWKVEFQFEVLYLIGLTLKPVIHNNHN